MAAGWRQISTALSDRLFNELHSDPLDRSAHRTARASISLALAYALATLVHSLSLALLALGVWVLWRPWTNLFAVIGAFAAVLLAWAVRPKLSQPPEHVVSRDEAPTLYLLADRLAGAMRTDPPHGIAISADFNASYGRYGWRRRPYVELGLPLLLVLEPRQRAAVLAHELSHGANGDPMRSLYLHQAVDTVATWSAVIRPHTLAAAGGLVGLLSIPFELAALALSETLLWTAHGIWLLVLRESQRAEYLADRLAASVVGTEAMCSALDALHPDDAVDLAIQRMALNGSEEGLSTLLRDTVGQVPDSERERRRRLARRQGWRVDSSHPPTALRIDMLASRDSIPPSSRLHSYEEEQLDRELATLEPDVKRRLVNHYLVGIHG